MRLRRLVGAAAAAVIVAGGLSAGMASADPAGSNPISATVDKDFGCTVLDEDGGLVLGFSSHSVQTSSGHSTLTCQAEGVTPPTDGKALVQSGFLCGTFAGVTSDSHFVLTPAGKAKLVCRV